MIQQYGHNMHKYVAMNKTRKQSRVAALQWKAFDDIIGTNANNLNMESSIDMNFCTSCNYILAFTEEGVLCCTNTQCGIMYKQYVDLSAEWRFYGADDNQSSDPSRCGMPINPLLEESSYGCKVVCIGKMSYQMQKIRRYNEWISVKYAEKKRYEEFQIISLKVGNANMPRVIADNAHQYYAKMSEWDETFRKGNRDGLIAGAIWLSCMHNKCSRTPKEIAIICGTSTSDTTWGCNQALEIIDKLNKNNTGEQCNTNFARVTSEGFVARYCSKLEINSELTQLCEFIAAKVNINNIMVENTPQSTAAGIVYLIVILCNLSISKTDIKQISGISEVTISKCQKKLDAIKHTFIPTCIKTKYNMEF